MRRPIKKIEGAENRIAIVQDKSEKCQRKIYKLESHTIKPEENVQVIKIEKRKLKTTILHTKITKVQDEKSQPSPLHQHDNKINLKTTIRQVHEKKKPRTGAHNDKRKRRHQSKHRLKRYRGEPFKKVLFMAYLAALGQHAECLPTTTVDTIPVVFGADVIVRCTGQDDSKSSINWLKGSHKQYITDGNSSLYPDKYTVSLYKDGGEYLYVLIIHKFALADADLYHCEYGFSSRELNLYLNQTMIYLPMDDDISMNISIIRVAKSPTIDIHFRVNRIYPRPNCTGYYEKSEISNDVNITLDEISSLYMVDVNIMAVDCYGVFNINCSVSSRSYSHSVVVNRCPTANKIKIERLVFISISVAIFIAVTVVYFVWLYRNQNKCEKIRHLQQIVYKKIQLIE